MLIPRKVKYRKVHKGRRRFVGKATAGASLSYGKFGLRADTWQWVTSRQIEAARRAMTRFVKRGGKIWIRVFPDKPITAKGSQSTMGSGKGAVDHYVAVVKPGMILFEMDGIDEATAREALRLAAHKLPVRTTFTAKG